MLRRTLRDALLIACLAFLASCYASSASRRSGRIVRAGFDFEERGPWVVVSGPGSLLLAGGNLVVGSLVAIGGGVDPREPAVKWFHSYPGAMHPAEQVAILCHRERFTWVSGIRPASGVGWQSARHEKWHFPICIEALPGSYELEVHYFEREIEDDLEQSVSRQAESTEPSVVRWEAEAGRVYRLTALVGDPQPAEGTPPQRHIPRSRAMGTTWWDLEQSDWTVRIEPVSDWRRLEGPTFEQRRAWMKYEERRR